jgi:alpha-L-fucosidase 2
VAHSYEELWSAHLRDYQPLFSRVRLSLTGAAAAEQPTDKRLRLGNIVHDPGLSALYAQFGRYLLISSSRPGTQPANLQGIWNDQPRPVWGSDYTVNINLQMNYWLAEVANLTECHQPLCDFVADVSVDGRDSAGITYGCRGWAMHNGSDIWRTTRTAGDGYSPAMWTMWTMGGAWLCQHLWEHYAFGGDLVFLRDAAYPIMRGAAEFCLDWLIEDRDGFLVTCPSTSPENAFIGPEGTEAAVTVAASMDMQIIWDLFTNCIEASIMLGVDSQFRSELQAARARLLPPRAGKHGQLQEWAIDFDEIEPGHRHRSHLFAVHPGRQITPRGTPALAMAAKRSLERRDAHSVAQVGWSTAWAIAQWARLGESEHAHACVVSLLNTSTLPNLFNDGPPFQIDGNFGGAAGIFELLLQSHAGSIDLLPALPAAWPDGSVRGLRARGGFTVDIQWSGGRLDRATVLADHDGPCLVRYRLGILVVDGPELVATQEAPDLNTTLFTTIGGRPVTLHAAS